MVVESSYLKLVKTRDSFHPKVQRAVDNICHCIIDLVVRHRGDVSMKKVEEATGMKNISVNFAADIIKYMAKEGIVEIRSGRIVGNVAKLTMILEHEKTFLPAKHGKPWSEDEYVQLAELHKYGLSKTEIAKKMGRTVSSIDMQASLIRKAYRLIPIIEKHSIVRLFASVQKSPNPKN